MTLEDLNKLEILSIEDVKNVFGNLGGDSILKLQHYIITKHTQGKLDLDKLSQIQITVTHNKPRIEPAQPSLVAAMEKQIKSFKQVQSSEKSVVEPKEVLVPNTINKSGIEIGNNTGTENAEIYNDETILPSNWRKHAGKKLANVPEDYLIWCYENNRVNPPLKVYIEKYILK